MVFAALGLSYAEGHATSKVALSGVAGLTPVDVWIVAGPMVAALGGGVRYQFSPRIAFTAALRANLWFGGSGSLFSVGPELGVAYGF